MTVEALDKKISFTMFVKGIGKKLQSIVAKSISPEEKLDLITAEMEKDVREKRLTARQIRTQMVALSDPETEELEPMERLKARREKIVALGAKVLKDKEIAESTHADSVVKAKEAQLSQLTQEAKALKASLSSMEATHQTLKESYGVALESYKTALAAYEHVKSNGKTMLYAIKAHQDALRTRDRAKQKSKVVDASFLNDLAQELEKAKGELRSDKQLDKELDATQAYATGPVEEPEANAAILEEFRAAQK